MFRSLRRARQLRALLSAASQVDTQRLQRALDRGITIDDVDKQGNTALHQAFYTGEQRAIANLRAFGADDTVRNHEGLTPPAMAEVAAAERLLQEAVSHLTIHGTWRNEQLARPIYNRLYNTTSRILNPALVRLARKDDRRYELSILAIKIGAKGTDAVLAWMLNGFGDEEITEVCLNAGSRVVREAAEDYARRRGYLIFHRSGRQDVEWGRF